MQAFKDHRRPVGASNLLVGPFIANARAGTLQGPTALGHMESSCSEDSMYRDLSPPPTHNAPGGVGVGVQEEEVVRRRGAGALANALDVDEIDVLPRALTVGCMVSHVAHLRDRSIMLHVALDEKHTWKAELGPEVNPYTAHVHPYTAHVHSHTALGPEVRSGERLCVAWGWRGRRCLHCNGGLV